MSPTSYQTAPPRIKQVANNFGDVYGVKKKIGQKTLDVINHLKGHKLLKGN